MEVLSPQINSKLVKANHVAAAVSALVVGVTNTFVVASKTPGAPFGSQVLMTVSRLIGPSLTTKLANAVGVQPGALPPQGVNPLGFLNSSTYGGAIMLIVGTAGRTLVGGKWGLKYAWPWLFAIGGALLGSGIFGGILDPNPGSTTTVGAIGSGAGRFAFSRSATSGFAGVAGYSAGAGTGGQPPVQGGSYGFNTGRGAY